LAEKSPGRGCRRIATGQGDPDQDHRSPKETDMPAPPRRFARFLPATAALTTLSLAGVVGIGNASPAAAWPLVAVVGSDEPIQPALDAVQPGSTVVVLGGVHAEQLTITKDRIRLIGVGAVLTPPVVADSNTCSGVAGPAPDGATPTQAGICVTGDDVAFGTSTVSTSPY